MKAFNWTALPEVRAKLLTRWTSGDLLREALVPGVLFPMRISLKYPQGQSLVDDFTSAQSWVKTLSSAAEKAQLPLEWMDINHRQLGRNQLPVALLFDSLETVLSWLGCWKDTQLFIKCSQTLLRAHPSLMPWVIKCPHQLLQLSEQLPLLMVVLAWRQQHPAPGIYLRQLSLPGVDTKFIERHQKILAAWFELTLATVEINSTSTSFAMRYGFKSKPTSVRFRLLDERLFIHGLSDLSIPETDFCRLELGVDTVFIVENDINALAFPAFPRAMVLFGRGYGFDSLLQANWLKNKRLFYWGDIDTHGFAILSQFRSHFSQTKSLLMDTNTLLTHQAHWSTEAKPSRAELIHLSADERALYVHLQANKFGDNVRLEQEYILFDALGLSLKCIDK